MDLSIIIVNYNTAEYLRRCLDSISVFSNNIKYEVIVVDNNSTDQGIKNFPSLYKGIKFFFREINDGFGAGCNFGAEKAKGKYFLFLNPDIIFISDVLFEIFLSMEKDESIGVVSPVYVEDNDKLSYSYNFFPGVKSEFYESIGIGSSGRIEKLLSTHEIRNNLPFEVDWVMGSFIFIRSDVFRRIEGFDRNIFLYFEDIDLQFNVKKIGYKIICRPDLKIRHYKRSSVRSYYGENLYYYHMARGNLIYMYKHFNIIERNFARLFHISAIICRMVILPFRLKFRNKKKQKFDQYKLMLLLYLKNKRSIFESKFMTLDPELHDKSQITSNDEFWNT